MWVNASTRPFLNMTPYTPCLSPTPPLPHSSFHPYLFICHPLTIPLNINLIYWREPFLVPPLPHYVSSMFLLCFYGSFFLDATDFHSRIPYVVVNDQTPGSIIIYLPSPSPSILYFLSYYYLNGFGLGGFGSATLWTTCFQGSIGSFCFQFRNSQLTL